LKLQPQPFHFGPYRQTLSLTTRKALINSIVVITVGHQQRRNI